MIALREAKETHYWLRLLKASEKDCKNYVHLIESCEEIIKILNSIITSTKRNFNLKK